MGEIAEKLWRMIEVHYRGGVELPGAGLWLDPRGSRSRAFVSHAHADHFARHQRVICSEVTGVLLAERFGMKFEQMELLAFGEGREWDGYLYQLLPAGHIFGSAMLHLTCLETGDSLLYTGDFKTRRSRTAEEPVFRHAQTLIMETTFGLSKYVFPSTLEIEARIVGFVQECLESGEVPVLFGYSLGKAQEAHALLHENGIACVLHKTVAAMNDACVKAGASTLDYEVFDGEVAAGRALICPPNSVRSTALRRIKNKRTAMLSGWALNPGASYRYRTDTAFPLSDHADHSGLLECVQRVNPQRVLTLHGSAREFARELREAGIEAWSVFGNDQMELGLVQRQEQSRRRGLPRPTCGLSRLSDLCAEIMAAGGRRRKVELLASYLRELEPETVELAARYLSGRVLPKLSEMRHLQLGRVGIRAAAIFASGIKEARYREISATQADAARTVRLVMEESGQLDPRALEIAQLNEMLLALATTKGVENKARVLGEFLRKLHPCEAEMVVRLLTGGLRMGLKEGLMEDAVAAAFGAELDEVRRAHMLSGDMGETAVCAREGRLGDLSLRPSVAIKCMLASPEKSARAICERLGGDEFWVEEKYDGIRLQAHKFGGEVYLFSRDLRPLNDEFPELVRDLGQQDGDFVLDGELVAFAEGRRLNFFDLQKRLGAHTRTLQGDLFLGESVPVRVVVFDLLWFDGRSLIDEPLYERRRLLESLGLRGSFEVIRLRKVRGVEEMERAFKASKAQGNEGLIVKNPSGGYLPGRRGKSWLKLKQAMPTLDCVVIKAQHGHGRRAEVLSDYTFAVRDESTGALRTIGKAYSGLTDIEIEELSEHFRRTAESKRGRVLTVKPSIVLEIAFDSLRRSKRHDSGLALRFPRIKAIRRDKTVAEIDTLAYAESLLEGAKGNSLG